MTSTPERTKLTKLCKQLSLGHIKRRIVRRTVTLPSETSSDEEYGKLHLLEEAEPVSTSSDPLPSSHSRSDSWRKDNHKQRNANNGGGSGGGGDVGKEKDDGEELSKYKIPSSLVTLTEAEKRQLEDVLMRIGLKDCGL